MNNKLVYKCQDPIMKNVQWKCRTERQIKDACSKVNKVLFDDENGSYQWNELLFQVLGLDDD